MLNYGFSVTIKDNATVQMQRIGSVADSVYGKMKTGLQKVNTQLKTTGTSVDGLNAELNKLREVRNISVNIKEITRANQEIAKIERQISKIENMGKGMNWGRIGTYATGIALTAGAALTALVYDSAQVGARYETPQAILANKLSSQTQAKQGIDQVTQFANMYGLNQLEAIQAYTKLSSAQGAPSMTRFKNWSNIVARTPGKNMDQFSEALLDAQGGEFVRLQEFGIRGKQGKDGTAILRDVVSGYTKTVQNTGEEIMKFLDEVSLQKGTVGTIEAKAATNEAAFARMGNAADTLKIKIASGLQPAMKPLSQSVVTLANAFGQYAAPMARSLANGLTSIITLSANSLKYIGDNAKMFKELSVVVGVTAGAYGIYTIAANGAAIGTWLLTTAQWAYNAALTANPIGVVIVALGAAAAAMAYLWNKSEGFRGFLYGLWGAVKVVFSGIADTIGKVATGAGDVIQGIVSGDFKQVKKGAASLGSAAIDVMAPNVSKVVEGYKSGYMQGVVAVYNSNRKMPSSDSLFSGNAFSTLSPSATTLAPSGSNVGGSEGSTGGDKVGTKNVYIQIQSLVKELNFNGMSPNEITSKLREEIPKVLIEASNDFNVLGA